MVENFILPRVLMYAILPLQDSQYCFPFRYFLYFKVLTNASVPSTLIKCLYLFFDLPPHGDDTTTTATTTSSSTAVDNNDITGTSNNFKK